MKITLSQGRLYVDNFEYCRYEASNGTLTPDTCTCEARYAHAFGKLLPYVTGVGWLGADAGVQVVLGIVHGRAGVIPDSDTVRRLVDRIDAAFDAGDPVLVEVM